MTTNTPRDAGKINNSAPSNVPEGVRDAVLQRLQINRRRDAMVPVAQCVNLTGTGSATFTSLILKFFRLLLLKLKRCSQHLVTEETSALGWDSFILPFVHKSCLSLSACPHTSTRTLIAFDRVLYYIEEVQQPRSGLDICMINRFIIRR